MLLNVKYRTAADVKYCPLEKSNGQCDIYFQLKKNNEYEDKSLPVRQA